MKDKTMKTLIVQLERTLPDNIVRTVHWRCEKGEASTYGSVGLPQPETEPIPFDDLTEEQIIEWLGTRIDFEEIEANIDAQIEAIENPTSASGLPWEPQAQEDNNE
jgi:hypothetical protein